MEVNIDDILNGNINNDQTDDDAGSQEQESESTDLSLIQKEIATLRQQNKDLQELIRQRSVDDSEIEELKKFKKRIVGESDEELERRKRQEILDKYDSDPISFINEKFEERAKELENKEIKNRLATAMKSLQKKYIVDFDRDYPKIVAQLNNFSKEAKRKNPEKVLLDACRLAKVIKKREVKDIPTSITGSGRNGGVPNQDNLTEAEMIKKRFLGKSKKSTNVFGI